ncbi:uncharacterized protein [Haliotis asinina]|uniref:uncharacterized protein n=1 Tax=Haliotis asinina TaxID=109174 RepID=UPI00353271B6
MTEEPMGVMRMCRGVTPWYRKKTCLVWTLIVVGAVAYIIYTQRQNMALRQTIMEHISQIGTGGVSSEVIKQGGGFWDTHGGNELSVGNGKIRVRRPFREPEDFGELNQDREPPVNNAEEVKVEAHIDTNKHLGNVVKVDDVIDIDHQEQDIQDVPKPVHPGNIPEIIENKDENKVPEVKVENKVPEVKDEVKDVKNNFEFEKEKQPVKEINREPEMHKNEVARIISDDKEKIAALKRKQEFAPKVNNVVPPGAAGIVDAALPDRATLNTWSHARIESTFHNYVIVLQTKCAIIAHMGRRGHGGWDVCHADGYRTERPCLMYSFGFDSDFSFEDDVAKRYGCETHYFDPKMKVMDGLKRQSGVTIHALTLSSDNGRTPSGWKVRTLATVKNELFHTEVINILKVDIEDNEWRAIPEMFQSGVMDKVNQFLLEIHVLSQSRTEPTKDEYINYLMLMRDIYIGGFRIARSNADNIKIKSKFGEQRPQTYEILFLRV